LLLTPANVSWHSLWSSLKICKSAGLCVKMFNTVCCEYKKIKSHLSIQIGLSYCRFLRFASVEAFFNFIGAIAKGRYALLSVANVYLNLRIADRQHRLKLVESDGSCSEFDNVQLGLVSVYITQQMKHAVRFINTVAVSHHCCFVFFCFSGRLQNNANTIMPLPTASIDVYIAMDIFS